MKKLLLILLTSCPLLSFGQASDTTYWKIGGVSSLSFSQVSLTNWAAGGNNSVAFNSYFNTFANYTRDRVIWENSLELGYGLIKQADADFEKSDDKINLSTKYGRTLSESNDDWFWTVSLNFRTQFADGFEVGDNTTPISRFLAPGYLVVAAGLDYKPNEYFSLAYAPVTGKITIVNDDLLAAQGAFGVDPGSKSRTELGSFLSLHFKKDIMENVNLESRLQLFSNYSENPENIDVNWDNAIIMKINRFLSASLINQLIFDEDIRFPITNSQGDVIGDESNIQFKSIFGIGLTYKFGAGKDE